MQQQAEEAERGEKREGQMQEGCVEKAVMQARRRSQWCCLGSSSCRDANQPADVNQRAHQSATVRCATPASKPCMPAIAADAPCPASYCSMPHHCVLVPARVQVVHQGLPARHLQLLAPLLPQALQLSRVAHARGLGKALARPPPHVPAAGEGWQPFVGGACTAQLDRRHCRRHAWHPGASCCHAGSRALPALTP